LQPLRAVRRLRAFRSDRRASVSVELALTLPMLITLLGGGLEITNYVLIHQKVERTSATISDLVAQSVRMTEGQMTSLFSAAGKVMKPFDLASRGNVVVSSITGIAGKASISWQESSVEGGNGSRFGKQGDDATTTLKAIGLKVIAGDKITVLREGENIIACEVFYHYRPMLFKGIVEEATLYRYAFFRPRFGKLDVLYR
jgi:Flp pilus assembly protein TadG